MMAGKQREKKDTAAESACAWYQMSDQMEALFSHPDRLHAEMQIEQKLAKWKAEKEEKKKHVETEERHARIRELVKVRRKRLAEENIKLEKEQRNAKEARINQIRQEEWEKICKACPKSPIWSWSPN